MPGGGLPIKSCFSVFRLGFLGLAAGFLLLLPGGSLSPAQAVHPIPSITFTKVLKGSTPEYFSLHIDKDGQVTYDSHKLEDPAAPRSLQISSATTARIFSLTQSLNYFRSADLDTHHKVANIGLKTLTYQDGQKTGEVQFNYSENHFAQQLTDIMEKISNVEERISQLEYAMKYDRLSLPQILVQVYDDLNNGLYVEADLMIPTLEKISNDSHYLHLAQMRARQIEARIRKQK